jgi:two-component system OmpR family sensor kinase
MLHRLEAAFRRERHFIRETSHELRTPITICLGHLEVLGPDPGPAEVAEVIAVITDELERMSRTVRELSDLVRIEDPASLRLVDVPMPRFVEQVATKAAPLLDGRLRVVPPPAAQLQIDPQRLTQALMNLLENAVLHTLPGTPVELRVVGREGGWRFEVSDRGGGVAPALEEAMFLPFVTTRERSSGLGLAILASIARAHGGTAGVENHPGVGATFWLEVPGRAEPGE